MSKQNTEFKSARVDLPRCLNGLEGEVWCIIKLPEAFPQIRRGGDLDIFCYDLKQVANRLLVLVVEQAQTTRLKTRVSRCNDKHWHLDLLEGEDIECRFDLYGALPTYRRLNIKPALFETIIEGAVCVKSLDKPAWQYYVPAPVDDALIRYLEYCEYYWSGPDKLHHLDHIENLVQKNEDLRVSLFEKIHRYTAFPCAADQLAASPQTKWPKRKWLQIGKYIAKLRATPVHLWPIKVLRRSQVVAKQLTKKQAK